MVQIRTFEGTADELSDFVQRIWRAYSGKMTFPLWTPDYFRWQLDLDSIAGRQQILEARIDDQRAGILIGAPVQFRRNRTMHPGLVSSWLSIAPEFRGRGIVTAFKQEQDRRLAESGDGLILAYRYFGSKHSLSRKPTDPQLHSGYWESRKVGFWVRLLDPSRAAKWYVSPFQRTLTKLSIPLTLPPRDVSRNTAIRRWTPNDLDRSVEVVRESFSGCSLAVDWTPEALHKHCTGFGNALVAEEDGQVAGLITWHVLTFVGQTEEPIAVIDLVAIENLSGHLQRALINGALSAMKQSGAIIALKLRTGDVPAPSLLLSGFFPWFSDSHETVHSLNAPLSPVTSGRHHVLWR